MKNNLFLFYLYLTLNKNTYCVYELQMPPSYYRIIFDFISEFADLYFPN